MTYSEWAGKPYRVQVEDEDGARWWVKIPDAVGPADAKAQAKLLHPSATPLRAQPYICPVCIHPLNDHNPSTGICRRGWTSGDEVWGCSCQEGFVAGRTAENLYPGERKADGAA